MPPYALPPPDLMEAPLASAPCVLGHLLEEEAPPSEAGWAPTFSEKKKVGMTDATPIDHREMILSSLRTTKNTGKES